MTHELGERFWAQVDKNGPVPVHAPTLGPCWLWTGYVHRSGYGRYGKRQEGQRVHRLAYTELVGPIPEGLTLDHLCRVKACVNAANGHLEVVTSAENKRRGLAAQTHCRRVGHELSGDNVYTFVQDGYSMRKCMACQRESQSAPVVCPGCGRTVRADSLPAHRRSVVHVRALAALV